MSLLLIILGALIGMAAAIKYDISLSWDTLLGGAVLGGAVGEFVAIIALGHL